MARVLAERTNTAAASKAAPTAQSFNKDCKSSSLQPPVRSQPAAQEPFRSAFYAGRIPAPSPAPVFAAPVPTLQHARPASARHALHARTDSAFADARASRFEDALDDAEEDVVSHPLIHISEHDAERQPDIELSSITKTQDASKRMSGAPAAAVLLAKQAKRASATAGASVANVQQIRALSLGAELVPTLHDAFEASKLETSEVASKRSSRISARRTSLPAGVALSGAASPSIDECRPTPPPKSRASSGTDQSTSQAKFSSSYGRSATPVSFKPIRSAGDSPDPRCVPHALLGPQTSTATPADRARSPTPMLTRMKSAFALKSTTKLKRSGSTHRLGGDASVVSGRATPTFSENSHAESAGHKTLTKVKSSLSLSLFRHRRGGRADTTAGDASDSTDYDAARRSSSHMSHYSDWSFASMSSADSHGLPLPSEEPGSQERYVRKKSSVAASLLLGKIFKSKQRNAKTSIDVDEVTATVERRRQAQLRAQDSSMTLRPRRPSSSAGSRASTLSSVGSELEAMAPRPALSLERRESALLQREAEHALVEPPQLPSFHFSRPSYSGDGFRVDPTELSYISRFGHGAEFEPARAPPHPTSAAHHRRTSSGLPKRKGLRDVFDIDLKRGDDHKLPQDLERRPSAADIGKVSTATANLENLLHDFQASPSTMNLTGQYSHQGSSPLTSSSEQHFAPGDSPTPLRKRSAQVLRSESKLRGSIPISRLSPLKLAVSGQSLEQPSLYIDTALHRRDGSVSTDDSSTDESSSDHAQLPLPPTAIAPTAKLSAAATLSPDEDAPRPSFDFTGEYNQLSKSADRTSFYEAMHDAGIEPATFETASRVSPVQPLAARPRNVFYGVGTAFRLGGAAQSKPAGTPASTSEVQVLPKKHIPHNSIFSVNSMSSVGHVINTGIAGQNFVNVFERDFGSAFELPGKPASDIQDCTSSSFAQLRELESDRHIESINVQSRHYREASNASTRDFVSRPDVDSDRMFGTALRAVASKPSSVFALNRARSAITLEVIADVNDDNLDGGNQACGRPSSLQTRSIASRSSAGQVDDMLGSTLDTECSQSSSGSLASRQLSVGSTGKKWATKGMFATAADESACYESNGDASGADASIDTSSIRSRPAPPRLAAKKASSDGCNTPELLSPSATEMSSKMSTDVQSILSLTGPRHAQRPSVFATPAQVMNSISEEAAVDPVQSWVRLQQETDKMIGRSVEQWPDTPGSKMAMSSESETAWTA